MMRGFRNTDNNRLEVLEKMEFLNPKEKVELIELRNLKNNNKKRDYSYGEMHTAKKIKEEMSDGISCIHDEMTLKEMTERSNE